MAQALQSQLPAGTSEIGVGEGFSSTLLIIDDDRFVARAIADDLEQDGLEILIATDAKNALDLVVHKHPPIVIMDLVMPEVNGMELLESIVAYDPGIDVVLMTGYYSTESAVEAIQKGACDYLPKPIRREKLRERIGKLLQEARRRQQSLELDRKLVEVFQFEGIVGRSPAMLEVFARVRRVAPHFRTLLLTGATGTGKELIARALHRLSPVANHRFAVCNCAAVVESLFESELFGYVKGAFTGAYEDKVGLFEFAHGGTVFLDEIGEVPAGSQAKLLRVLQSQELQRVGSPQVRHVDVRVIAATNHDLRALSAERRFREDLYYRLSTIEIKIPSLAERLEDMPLLQRHFVERFSAEYKKPVRGITRRAQALLARYDWPGNVRELENVIGNACMMAKGDAIDIADLPEYLRQPRPRSISDNGALLPLAEVQRRHILRVLEQVGGNKVRAAEILGISRGTLYNMLAEEKGAQATQ